MPPADPPAATPPPAERPAPRRKTKRRPPKRNPHPATRLREASRYSVRATVSLEADLHAELIQIAQMLDLTFPEAVRRAARAGLESLRATIGYEIEHLASQYDPGPGTKSPGSERDS